MSTEAWRTLSDHLDHALELSDAERLEWLNQLRDREPELAAKVAEMLEARAQPRFAEFLAGPSPLPEGVARISTLIGRRIGPYVIEAEIGRGGMGSLWRARSAAARGTKPGPLAPAHSRGEKAL